MQSNGVLPAEFQANIQLTTSKDVSQGNFASNIALMSAKSAKMSPRDLATQIVDNIVDNDSIEKIEIAGPGFINFFLASRASTSVIQTILKQQQNFGRSNIGQQQKIQVEFVSANPTGPLHVGHGRGAAYGATLANILKFVGYDVATEYYVNDDGRQMDILAVSVWFRYLELCGEDLEFPNNGYQGDYIFDIAADLHRENGESFRQKKLDVFEGVNPDSPEGDKEKHIDDLIDKAKKLLGKSNYKIVFNKALTVLVEVIRKDLKKFGVEYDCWFYESQLSEQGQIEKSIEKLQQLGHVYKKQGALWFRSSEFGDEKDRVVKRENGQSTYFTSDIAYHQDKFNRGFERVINIWGADHHGYIARVKASLTALEYDADKLEIQLVQFANLFENGEKVAMSTRSGEFVTLRELREDVGADAARFFYVMRKADAHMDFDLSLAREQSSDNPVYYVQYAHARICSVEKQLQERSIEIDVENADLSLLEQNQETQLLKQLALFPDRIISAANRREPHIVINLLRDIASHFHSWYNAHHFIIEDQALMNSRIALAFATRQVLQNGLTLIGVSAPEKM